MIVVEIFGSVLADEVVTEGVGDLGRVLGVSLVDDLGVGLIAVHDEVGRMSAFGFLCAVAISVVLEADAADGQAAGGVGDAGEFVTGVVAVDGDGACSGGLDQVAVGIVVVVCGGAGDVVCFVAGAVIGGNCALRNRERS